VLSLFDELNVVGRLYGNTNLEKMNIFQNQCNEGAVEFFQQINEHNSYVFVLRGIGYGILYYIIHDIVLLLLLLLLGFPLRSSLPHYTSIGFVRLSLPVMFGLETQKGRLKTRGWKGNVVPESMCGKCKSN